MFFAVLLLGAYASNNVNPEIFWAFAFFGLFYPYVLLVNAGFVIFWIWRKKWYFIISLAIIIGGWSHTGKYFQASTQRRDSSLAEPVKVMSYNVRLFNRYEWDKRTSMRDSILNFIVNEDPEILCFQEFFTATKPIEHSEYYLGNKLPDLPNNHIFYTHKPNYYSDYGLATYSRYPIIAKKGIRFTDSYNSCIITDISIRDDTIRVFNVHLQSIKLKKSNLHVVDTLSASLTTKQLDEMLDISGRLRMAYIKRARQVDELNAYIRQSPYPVVVCGDFNDTPVSYTYNTIRGNMHDAFIESGRGFGNTYRGNFPSFRIDYIFHSQYFHSSGYQTYNVTYSDHFPVSCFLQKKL